MRISISRRRFNPSNGFVCLRTPILGATKSLSLAVSIRRTDLCAFELLVVHNYPFWNLFQSVERICVPSNLVAWGAQAGTVLLFQSVERICVPSNPGSPPAFLPELEFQSVERICVPSNLSGLHTIARQLREFQSVERICVPSNLPRTRRRSAARRVSIRRTDLCAFELIQPIIKDRINFSFNPSNGFVCLRTLAL